MSAAELIERLRAKDARWQEMCDGWVARLRETNPETITEEVEARLRRSDDREAADRIASLETRVAELTKLLEVQKAGHRLSAKDATQHLIRANRYGDALKRIISAPLIDHTDPENNPRSIARLALKGAQHDRD